MRCCRMINICTSLLTTSSKVTWSRTASLSPSRASVLTIKLGCAVLSSLFKLSKQALYSRLSGEQREPTANIRSISSFTRAPSSSQRTSSLRHLRSTPSPTLSTIASSCPIFSLSQKHLPLARPSRRCARCVGGISHIWHSYKHIIGTGSECI